MRKANMMIIRGRDGQQFSSEAFSRLQHHAYSKMQPKRFDDSQAAVFDLVLLVPGRLPIKCEVVFYRGCNCLAIPSAVVDFIPAEFGDPLQAMEYSITHGLEVENILLCA